MLLKGNDIRSHLVLLHKQVPRPTRIRFPCSRGCGMRWLRSLIHAEPAVAFAFKMSLLCVLVRNVFTRSIQPGP